jgi:hypothetical protein
MFGRREEKRISCRARPVHLRAFEDMKKSPFLERDMPVLRSKVYDTRLNQVPGFRPLDRMTSGLEENIIQNTSIVGRGAKVLGDDNRKRESLRQSGKQFYQRRNAAG